MRTFIFILLAFVNAFGYGLTQSCLPDSTVFSTQNQIDNFSTDNPGCTIISGDIAIHGVAITNLSGLSNIVKVEGNLYIGYNPVLLNLVGLHNIDTIFGDLVIEHNDIIENLTGLTKLKYIGGNFEVRGHEDLTCFSGVSSLNFLGGSLIVEQNLVMTCFRGLANLHEIGANFILDNNESLDSLGGLISLTKIGGNLEILNCVDLKTFDGLSSIDTIGGNLLIYNNESLLNLNGFNGLESIGGDLTVHNNLMLNQMYALSHLTSLNGNLTVCNNQSLPNLCGLENIDPLTIDSLFIFNNEILSICDVESVCLYLDMVTNYADIHNNGTDMEGCGSVNEIQDACVDGGPYNCAALPVNLINFSVHHSGQYNILTWSTANEQNNERFDIQRKGNDGEFIVIGTVSGKGGSRSEQHYNWVDKNPLSDINYYRLSQVDYDGSFNYSKIIYIQNNKTDKSLKIVPNPASDRIYIVTANNEQPIKILNSIGYTVKEFNIIPEYIELADLPDGLYWVTTNEVVVKVIIVK